MSDDFVKCPFCVERLNENLLPVHIKKVHKSGTPLKFIIESVGQELSCESVHDGTAFACPFTRFNKCKFYAGSYKLFEHMQIKHRLVPCYYHDLGFVNYPSDFLERYSADGTTIPIALPAVPARSNLLPAPPQVATNSEPVPNKNFAPNTNTTPNQITINLDAIPVHFDTYVRGRNSAQPVTSSDVVSFMRSLQTAQDSSHQTPAAPRSPPAYKPTPPPAYKLTPSSATAKKPTPAHRYTPYLAPRHTSSPTRAAGPSRSSHRSSSPDSVPIPRARTSPKRTAFQNSSSDPFLAPPSSEVPLSIYDPANADDIEKEYVTAEGRISYRDLRAAGWVRLARISMKKIEEFCFAGVVGPKAVWRRVADGHEDFVGICIYHTALNLNDECDSNTFHCSGPMGSKHTDYYCKFRTTINLPKDTCWSCWSPTDKAAKPFFKHPPTGKDIRCTGREMYEDLYRGLTYIIFRCSALRTAIFNWLETPWLASKFHSTTDWVRWLELPASRLFVNLSNLLTIVWAYLEMYTEGSLPQGELKFDDPENAPPLFSIVQKLRK
ncbi:hypothetical protein BT96DRAFT_1008351 [Gymnopus androsaceus JB14]|uniref:Uncharacterized protein n=1 Tax=Gymnopus androsaceus JB14 TaxID=1447944 RepID=A0A6A4GF16_9AGAR|nr:hypothetical protein BT96DRAFT_1008351 [Gymnopus androsaceus JB14]